MMGAAHREHRGPSGPALVEDEDARARIAAELKRDEREQRRGELPERPAGAAPARRVLRHLGDRRLGGRRGRREPPAVALLVHCVRV